MRQRFKYRIGEGLYSNGKLVRPEATEFTLDQSEAFQSLLEHDMDNLQPKENAILRHDCVCFRGGYEQLGRMIADYIKSRADLSTEQGRLLLAAVYGLDDYADVGRSLGGVLFAYLSEGEGSVYAAKSLSEGFMERVREEIAWWKAETTSEYCDFLPPDPNRCIYIV